MYDHHVITIHILYIERVLLTAPIAPTNIMTVRRFSSIRRPYVKYALGPMYLWLTRTLQQPLIITAAEELNGLEACQNQCFNRSECDEVGNGDCCQWDENLGQCMSRIGHDICPGISTMSHPPALTLASVACHPTTTAITLPGVSAPRNISTIETESTPTTSPTNYYDRPSEYFCEKMETELDWFLCRGFSLTQLAVVIINLKVSSVFSIMGSSYVVQDVLRNPNKRKESTYHRIMLALSSADIIHSFFLFFLGSWVMPEGEQVFAVGSSITCGIAGFFTFLASLMTPLYNCSLATFYLLKLKYSWNDRKIKAIEKWLLFLPCAVGLIFVISAAATNSLGLPDGYGCMQLSNNFLLIIFAVGVLIFSFGYVPITMLMVYLRVRSVEMQAVRYSFPRYSVQKQTLKMSRRIMLQGILYTSAALFSPIIPCLFVTISDVQRMHSFSYTVEILCSIFLPLQGLFNALIYMIPLFKQIMKKRRKKKAQQKIQGVNAQQLNRDSIPNQQNLSINETPTRNSLSRQDIEAKIECKEEEILVDDKNEMIGASKQIFYPCDKMEENSDQEEETPYNLNASYESESEKVAMEKIRGEDSNIAVKSSLMVSQIEKEDDEDSDDDSFIDDYLKMIED